MGTYEVWTEPPVAELRNIRFLLAFAGLRISMAAESHVAAETGRELTPAANIGCISRMNDGEVRGAYLGSN